MHLASVGTGTPREGWERQPGEGRVMRMPEARRLREAQTPQPVQPPPGQAGYSGQPDPDGVAVDRANSWGYAMAAGTRPNHHGPEHPCILQIAILPRRTFNLPAHPCPIAYPAW
jgi:hypothetical protein